MKTMPVLALMLSLSTIHLACSGSVSPCDAQCAKATDVDACVISCEAKRAPKAMASRP